MIPGRITIPAPSGPGATLTLTGRERENLLLWKPRVKEAVTVTDGVGRVYRARVEEIQDESALLTVFEDAGELTLMEPRVTLLQALPARERMELIIQKTAELGVSAIVPFKSERSISIEERESAQKKAHRWNDIALAASKQCRRDTIARVFPYTTFEGAMEYSAAGGLKIMLYEKAGKPLKELLSNAKSGAPVEKVIVLGGPEGGFTDDEAQKAAVNGFTPVSLGRRILRAETASIIAVGIIGYELC